MPPVNRGGGRRLGGVPNLGGQPTVPRREPEAQRAVLKGTLRWVERDARRAALQVRDASAAGRQLIGRTLTLDLSAASVRSDDRDGDGRRTAADLLPGDDVTVKVRIADRDLASDEVLAPIRIVVTGP